MVPDPFNLDNYLPFKYFLCVFNMAMTVVLALSIIVLVKKVTPSNIDKSARFTIGIYFAGSLLQFAAWVQFLETKRVPDDWSQSNATFYLLFLLSTIIIT
jgi:hypothetical protein